MKAGVGAGHERTDGQTVKHNHFEFELNFDYDNFLAHLKISL